MNNDLFSRDVLIEMGVTCFARRNENGKLEAIISIDEAPTVELLMARGTNGVVIPITRSQNNFRWVKKGDIFPTYYCPKCGKEALGRMPSIDNFKYVKSPFCPFCGVRLKKPRITIQKEEEE